MNSRSAAREISILALPQLPKDESKLSKTSFEEIIIATSRSLTDYAKKNIVSVSSDLQKIDKFLLNAEIDHPDNEKHTTQIQPVLIPDTKILKDQINAIKFAAEELLNILELPELIIHLDKNITSNYVIELLIKYTSAKEKINEIIEQAAQKRDNDKKWKLSRMVRLERDILRIATTELLSIPETPTEVICDEAVKLAEKYGGDESKKFVNGLLRDIVEITRANQAASPN